MQTKQTIYSKRCCAGAANFCYPHVKKPQTHSVICRKEFPQISLNGWDTWSMLPHTTEEIRNRLLTRPITDTCISYVCRFSHIDAEFLDEFLLLSTGWFHDSSITDTEFLKMQPIEYSPELIAKLIAAMHHEKALKHPHAKIKPYITKGGYFNTYDIPNRIDWKYIYMFQKFPVQYWAKYKEDIHHALSTKAPGHYKSIVPTT